MRYYFEDAIIELENIGLTDVLLPFLLIFVIVFAILQRVEILGEKKKNMNVVLALILGLAVVIPHVTGNYPSGMDPVEIINAALPGVSLVIVAIIMFFILVGAFGGEISLAGDSVKGWVTIFSIGVVAWVFGDAAGWWGDGLPRWLDFLRDSDLQALIVTILIFGLIIMFVTKEEKDEDDDDDKKSFLEHVGELIKASGKDSE